MLQYPHFIQNEDIFDHDSAEKKTINIILLMAFAREVEDAPALSESLYSIYTMYPNQLLLSVTHKYNERSLQIGLGKSWKYFLSKEQKDYV